MAPLRDKQEDKGWLDGLTSLAFGSAPPPSASSPRRSPFAHLTAPALLAIIDHPYLILSTAAVSTTLTIAGVRIYARYLKRIPNSDWVNPRILGDKRWIRGRVTSVGDADNFRLFHTPVLTWGKWRKVPDTTQDLKDQTIHVRIAGVDAPEAAHFGRPAQPYAVEALAWLKSEVEGKVVYCQLMRRDQYGRVVGTVVVPRRVLPAWIRSGRCVGLEMLRAGYATTYTQAGAEYGKWGVEEFQKVEEEAKKAKRGMWAKGTNLESPAHYKQRYAKGVDEAEQGPGPGKAMEPEPLKGWRAVWPFRIIF